jgi:hypothetical protein
MKLIVSYGPYIFHGVITDEYAAEAFALFRKACVLILSHNVKWAEVEIAQDCLYRYGYICEK